MTDIPHYHGFLLDDHLPGGRASGYLHVEYGQICFTSPDTNSKSLPLHGLNITRGGSGNRLIYFKPENSSTPCFYTSDAQILKNSHLLPHPEIQQLLRHARQKRYQGALLLLFFTALCAFTGYGLYLLKTPMVAKIVQQVPPTWENKLGDLVLAQATMGKTLIDTPETIDDLRKVLEPMLVLPELKDLSIKFHIVRDSTLNAFAIPGGHVVIHSGLIERAESWDELAGVIGHELAHLSQRHSLRQLMDSAGLFLVVQSFLGDVQGLLAVLLDHGSWLLTMEYSRDFEREADDIGFNYLIQSGFNPRGLLTFFSKIQIEQNSDAVGKLLNKNLPWLGTHPATDERIKLLQQRLAQKVHTEDPTSAPARLHFKDWSQRVLQLPPISTPDTHDSQKPTENP